MGFIQRESEPIEGVNRHKSKLTNCLEQVVFTRKMFNSLGSNAIPNLITFLKESQGENLENV